MQVSNKVKEAYKKNSIKKTLLIQFPRLGYTVEPEKVYQESMTLTEKVIDGDSFEIVGCYSSEFSVKIRDFGLDVAGQIILADICTEGTEDEPVRIFAGFVKSVEMEANKRVKKIIAYDILQTWAGIDITDWLNEAFPISDEPMFMYEFKRQFLDHMGIYEAPSEGMLGNEFLQVYHKDKFPQMSALDFIRQYCQINGAFGVVDRYSRFALRNPVSTTSEGAYPGINLYPPFYPCVKQGEISEETLSYYRKLDFQEYNVKPIDCVILRDTEEGNEFKFPLEASADANKYIIQGNVFAYNQPEDLLFEMSRNLYWVAGSFTFNPYNSQNNGLPFVECGLDNVGFLAYDFTGEDEYKYMTFPILSRRMTGIQALKDEYKLEGSEEQSEFITDLRKKVDSIRRETQTNNRIIEQKIEKEIDQKIEKLWRVEWVPDREHVGTKPMTFYCIEKKG